MDDKDKHIQSIVIEQSKKFLDDHTHGSAPTTASVSNKTGLSRTVASRVLNQAFKERLVIKVNTRPVCFIHVEPGLIKELNSEYESLEQFLSDYHIVKTESIIHQIIGWNRSLRSQIEQVKAGLMYPDNGLPIIIFGPSGTGKSYLAHCAYEYAIASDVLKKDAPFITINCAQYADNPELLSSILFGYVKGAFTGANSGKSGALEAADNGVLFLDEVHRLSAEGQEKLFTYMDTGNFSPLGDDTRRISSHCRLMFATTAKKERFLETFLRRVPIKITMPSLEERSFIEKKQLINSFFNTESARIHKSIEITAKTLEILYQHQYDANVGEAKNLIKSIVATAYAQQTSAAVIKIGSMNLPAIMYSQALSTQSRREFHAADSKIFNGSDSLYAENETLVDPVTVQLQRAWKYLLKMDVQGVKARQKYVYIVKNLMNNMYFSTVSSKDAIFKHTISEVREILNLMQFGQDFYDNNSFVYGVSVYIYYVLNLDVPSYGKIHISSALKGLFSKEYTFIRQLQPVLEKQFEITLAESDLLWLAIMVTDQDLPMLRVPAIIMAHGYATASSIADAANTILRYPVFSSIDMTPDATGEEMVNSLRGEVERLQPKDGLIIMIDMGSLSAISKQVSRFFSYSLLLIDKVSTPVALEVGNLIQQNKSLPEIRHSVEGLATKCDYYNVQPRKPNVILSTCMTGIGTAEQIRHMLLESFEGVIRVDVICVEFDKLKNGMIKDEEQNYNILAIVGVDDPHVPDIPYLGLEDIISGHRMSELKQILRTVASEESVQTVEQQLVKNFSLNRVMDSLTVLSPDKVIGVVERYILAIQDDLPSKLPNKIQIALYVHLGSMIERLVRGNGIKLYEGDNKKIKHDEIYSVLKKHISVLESEFMIQVPEPELAYIREIIVH